ncbi:MAG TPA: hypothetical protein VF591_07645 [Pyrinomonadaceae bacterium]|jgi:hypothetical protein
MMHQNGTQLQQLTSNSAAPRGFFYRVGGGNSAPHLSKSSAALSARDAAAEVRAEGDGLRLLRPGTL